MVHGQAHSRIKTAIDNKMTDTSRSAGAAFVRVAPSPTGYLHIGGARTALFNWLYAKGRGGKMLLRIEDTDRERNNPEAVAAIVDGLKWLELYWDGDTVSQFGRAHRHRQVAEELLANDHAYRSEEHTSELQSPCNLVCRLLLEKKKQL